MMAAPMVAAGQVGCAPKSAVTYYPRTHLTYATLSPKPTTSAFPSLLDSSSSEKQWARNCRSSGQESHGGFIREASHYPAFPVHLNARSRRTVCMRPAACPSVSSRGAALWIGSNCRGNYSCPRNRKWNSGDCEASHSSPSSWKRGRTARNIGWQISKMPNALSGPISTKPGSRKYQGSLSKRVMPHMAALQTGMKEGTFSAVENQNLEKAEAAWVFDEGQTFTGKVSENRIGAREASNDVPGEPETGDKLGLSEGAYMTVLEEGSALESVAVETATLMQQGSSSLATGRYSDEFQVSRFGIGFEDENNTAWEAAVAETAGILQQHGSSLKRLASGEGGTQVQTAVRETVKILQNGQGSFVRGRALKKRPQGNLWDRLQNTGVGKHLFRDMQMVSGWAKRTADNTGITNIAAKDVICVNKMSEWVKEVVGPSLKNGIRDTVALKFLEIEDAVSTSPAPWPQPYYPELRGFEVMAADVDTLGKYVEHIKSVTRNFRVPLQNNYDPDQIAAYFDHRPHVLIFRLLEVFAAFGSVALQSRVRKAALLWKNGGNISEEENTQLTMQTAEALKQALLGLGTTFIKVAQSLSARPDIIGTETAKVLAELQDRLPPFPSDEAVAIIEEEFGCSLRKIFAYLSTEPVAAASFGQVYRGCTIDGLEVAVKVQRPDLLFSVARDVYILRIGLILLKRVANLSNNYALVADELGHALYGELDYRHEASNAAEFAAAHKHVPWMYVPKTLPHLTGRKVLVMEWLSGDRPFDLQCVAQGMQLPDGTVPTWEQQQEAKDRLLNMVNKGTEAALIQLLETGVMHADPHPGNILLSPDGTLQFIDFGLICHMEKKHQGAMLALIAHLVNGEWQSLTDDLADMDVLKPTTDRFAVRLALERSFGEGPNAVIKNGVPDFSFGQITKSFFKVAYKFRFRLPPYYTLVLRSLASLEGFGLAVNPDFKTFGAAYPYVVRRLLLDYSPTTQRVLHSLLLDEKRQLKWDRISSLVAISRKSAADRAALDMVIVPNSVPEVVNSGETQMQESSQTASNLVGLVLAKEGVGLRRVLLEADTCALALVFVSTRAAMLRRKVANAIGEGIFVMLCEKFSFEGAQSGPITRDASEDSSSSNFLPLSQSSTLQKRRRLEFLLKAMLGRLRGKILLFARVGWSFITIICWALAIACHRYAVYISNVFLPTDHKTGAGMSQGQVDEHTRIRNKQGVVPTPL